MTTSMTRCAISHDFLRDLLSLPKSAQIIDARNSEGHVDITAIVEEGEPVVGASSGPFVVLDP